jgi:tripartite-type tricarboxylate transporter receptor subunit TctC
MRKILLGLILSLVMVLPALAADFPAKPIQIVVPWPPGGGSDLSARIMGEAVQNKKILPHPMIVTNVTGAAGLNAANNVLSAGADGYTILWEHPSNLTMAPIVANVNFRWNEFAIAGALGYSGVGLFVNAKSQWKTADDLFNYIKANPKKVRWALSMNTTGHYQFMQISESKGGLDAILLSLQGDKPKIVSVIGNNSETATAAIAALDPYIKSGDVRLLATLGSERNAFYPDVPTLKELGVNCVIEFWYSALVPKATPKAVIDVIADTLKKVAADPDTQAKLKQQFIQTRYLSPEETTKVWKETGESVEAVLKRQGKMQ